MSKNKKLRERIYKKWSGKVINPTQYTTISDKLTVAMISLCCEEKTANNILQLYSKKLLFLIGVFLDFR